MSEAARRWDRITGFTSTVGRRLGLQLFLKMWDNPFPDRTIQSLDVVSGEENTTTRPTAPILVAVTGI